MYTHVPVRVCICEGTAPGDIPWVLNVFICLLCFIFEVWSFVGLYFTKQDRVV